jgi:hypothetical protein
VPAARHQRGHVLCLAQQVCRARGERAKRLKQLEEENSKLKRIVADQALNITMLKDLVGKKW